VRGESQGTGPHAAGLQDPTLQAAEPALAPGRSCGTCSLCCKVLPVAELNKPAGQWCMHCVPGSGCAIHADRPQACRRFFCAWRFDPNLGPEWKPEACRFVLSVDPVHKALRVTVDPGMPLAWKQAPYYSRLKQFSESFFRQDQKILLDLRGKITVILPDREVPLGEVAPGEEIVVWREGSAYGARVRRGPELAQSSAPSSAGFEPPPVQAPAAMAGAALSADDPGVLESVFREAFEKTCGLLDDPSIDDLRTLSLSLRGRNKVLDETAETYAKAARAECRPGCVSCCYLMVSGTPFEVLSIARHFLQTRTAAEIEALKDRLRVVAEVPLDPVLRVKARLPCALLENDRCSAYELRPSVCRMALSQSRAACDACLKGVDRAIPYIEQPSKVAAAMQMGIDYALISRRNLSTQGSELSRALLIVLDDYEGALTSWLKGQDPFAGTHVEVSGAASSSDRAIAAAKRLGIA
jgi:Fe-S-cluster containining protein